MLNNFISRHISRIAIHPAKRNQRSCESEASLLFLDIIQHLLLESRVKVLFPIRIL